MSFITSVVSLLISTTLLAPLIGLEHQSDYLPDYIDSTGIEQTVEPDVSNTKYVNPLPIKDYWVNSYFGARCPSIVGSGLMHSAVDLAADDGTPIYAIADGTVNVTNDGVGSQIAGVIKVSHKDEKGVTFVSEYMHIWDSTKYVQVGDTVKAGQIIAEV